MKTDSSGNVRKIPEDEEEVACKAWTWMNRKIREALIIFLTETILFIYIYF